jgi:GNAT superfamily N-acetyltransferase
MSRVYTAESSIHGTGVFSSAHFSPGETILKIDDFRVVTDANPLDPAKAEFEHHCDYLASGKVVLMQAPERFINHHCEPNTFIRTISRDRYVVAVREIHLGDEITYDYCVNGDGDTVWDCSCKSPECRKRHLSGFFHLPVDVQARYLALLEDWFVAEHRDEVEMLKRRIEAIGAVPAPRREPSLIEAKLPLGIEKHGQSGIGLVNNPVLSAEETTVLFRSAWGEQAPDSPPAIDRCLAHICAYHDGRLVGFIKLAWDGGIHAFVLDTTVHPEHQRHGIGRRLVERAIEIAGRSGVEWLHVDYEQALEGFYDRCGFQPTSAGLIHVGG